MKKLKYLLILFILFFVFSLDVFAATTDITMVVTNPAEDMSSEINVSWHTQIDGTFVRFTIASDTAYANSRVVNGECSPVTFEGNITAKQCKATLTGLESGTEYIYKVGKTTFTDDYHFTTAGTDAFSFVHISDVHSYTPIPARVDTANSVLNKAKELTNNLEFVLVTGDSCAYGTVYDQWENFYKMDLVRQMMLVLTPGNHDYYDSHATTLDNSYFNAVTNNPDNGVDGVKGSTYFFKYNNALFISLDSEAAYKDRNTNVYFDNMKLWIKEVIANNPADFVIVYDHKPFYTGNGGSGTTTSFMTTNFGSIMDECGVDLVLSGDNHILARTKPLYNKNIMDSTTKGTIYQVAPQLGDRSVAAGTVPEVIDFTSGGKVDGGIIFTVESDKISLKTITKEGTILDTYEILSKSTSVNKTTFESSLNVVSNETDFSKATLSFNDMGAGRVNRIKLTNENNEIINTYLAPTNSFEITNIPTDVVTYKINVEATLRTGEVVKKEFTLENPALSFGTIENVRIEDNSSNEACLYWDSQLVEGKIKNFEVYVNGELKGTVDPSLNLFVLDHVSPYHANEVEFRAINNDDDVVFTKTLSYGEEGSEVYVVFNDTSLSVNEGKTITPTYVIFPEQELNLEFSSSDESIATVDENGVVTGVAPGTCTIKVNVVRRWDVFSEIQITVNDVPDAPTTPTTPEEPAKEKKGCFGASEAIFGFGLLGVVFVLRKRQVL